MSINQLAIYALILVLGWLLGLLSRSGGKRWREQYEAEHAARTTAEKAHQDSEAALHARIAELEQQARVASVSNPRIVAADRNDLSLIRGIDSAIEARLNEAGIVRYADLEQVGDADAETLEKRINIPSGTIRHEEWREQAALLASDLNRRTGTLQP